ncbi:MAG: radical SAM protein [Clostridia bacterium]
MPPISIMIKPASSLCNMRCEYCFYHSLAENRESFSYGLLKEELFLDIIKKAFEFTKGQAVNISFQGGEPLLRGRAFFRIAIEIANQENKYKSPINYGLQTNGLLIDDEWCEFFKTNNFLIGLSLDGNEKANEKRRDSNLEPTFSRIIAGANLLKKHKVDFNILAVVTPYVAKNIRKIYPFFTQNGFKHLQFIPCLSPLNGEKSKNTVTSKEYGDFLIDLFRMYLFDFRRGDYTSIRQLDNFVQLAHRRKAEQCGMNGHCTHQFVIEGDGEVYPCDFYCTDEYRLGNIKDTDFTALSSHPIAIKFIKESLLLPAKCKSCKYFMLCQGGCKRERLDIDKCEGYKRFFALALPHLKKMS